MTPSFLPFLLACAAPDDTGLEDCPPGSHRADSGLCVLDEDSGSTDGTGGALGVEGGPEAPEWTAAEALDRLAAALDVGMVESPTIMAAYEAHMAHRDDSCPSMEDPNSVGPNGVWQSDDCTTDDGWRFQGLGIYSAACDDGYGEAAKTLGVGQDQGGMLAQFTLTDPDGNKLLGGGTTAHECRFFEDGSGSCLDQVGGIFHQEGATSWIGARTAASLDIRHSWDADGNRIATLEGGVGYPEFDLSFDHIVMDWAACEGRPTGVLRLRDPTGYWHELRLDEDCSGCGPMTWRQLDEGRQCVDLVGHIGALLDDWEQPCWD